MNNRFINSIFLSAIGDALGWITEFEKTAENIEKKYKTSTITAFYDWEKYVGGRFNGYLDKINAGSYSDDTQLLLSVARSIKPDGSLDNYYFSKIELPAWLLYARGAGRTIKNAARKIERKSAQWNSNFFTYKAGNSTLDYKDSGANGAAMRILPIALANHKEDEKIKEQIFSNSIVTHGHPRAIAGAILYGMAVNSILKLEKNKFNYEEFLTEIGKNIESKFELSFLHKEKYLSWLNEWNKNSSSKFEDIYEKTVIEILNYLRETYKFLRDNKGTKDALKSFGCYSPKTKGSGVSTVIAGIYLACKFFDKPEKAIISAVNSIGTDTDSIAAFTGGLIGALYSEIIIPNKWTSIQDAAYLEKMAVNLYLISCRELKSEKPEFLLNNTIEVKEIDSDEYNLGDEFLFNPLGKGVVKNIDRQKTLTSGKYNLILDVEFGIGQTCRFSKLLDIEKNDAVKYFE
ncbi:MAG: ADP-ribosylglycohydrolase family protein [Bacteroidales bacterium]|nr:ADP-ribosylglycohydrolase family protein [Bacteroidales bacterium]MCF8351843.1 ADP-ribosylglycohydrolase family protein [Bacteroidales bacterium]MCF8374879.1 ADP-ribosylglycohydrolase family protein [Bacteroidales bacterium]MCF8399717.1 ADP-ribosylglycohydrolase family protein [Bacteroidales bacterium]